MSRFGSLGGVRLDLESFNRRFITKTHDEAFAITLLTPSIQSLLLAPPRLGLHVQPGVVALVASGSLTPARADALVRWITAWWPLVPGELEHW